MDTKGKNLVEAYDGLGDQAHHGSDGYDVVPDPAFDSTGFVVEVRHTAVVAEFTADVSYSSSVSALDTALLAIGEYGKNGIYTFPKLTGDMVGETTVIVENV